MRLCFARVFWCSVVAAAFAACSSHGSAGRDACYVGFAGQRPVGESSPSAGQSGAVIARRSSGRVESAGQSGSGGVGMGREPMGPRFIGRFDQSHPEAPVFAWPGTAIALRFKGTAIRVTLTDGGRNYFEVVVDDQHHVLGLQRGTKQYLLASNLSDTAHDVLLYRRSEPSFGETTFNGFDVAPGAYLPGSPLPTRRLEVIGDSILGRATATKARWMLHSRRRPRTTTSLTTRWQRARSAPSCTPRLGRGSACCATTTGPRPA